jgi:predicted transcriptional regulator of viral defense system
MMDAQPPTKKLLDLVRKAGVLRSHELESHGISRVYLKRLVDSGQLERIGRGLYTLAGADLGEKRGLAQASKRVPHGVICLLSALRLHGLTTQNPFEVWIAVDQKARRPAVSYPPLRIIHLSGKAFTSGIEEHSVEGINVRVYCAAKTVADCFKFRNKIGTDVALEALRDYRRKYRSGMDELWRYAKVVRVTRVMEPYLEALG